MHEEWTDKLSEYLDGEMPADEREAVEAHLTGCAHCTEVLEDLRRVITRARSIQPRPPHQDLWEGIAERIDAGSTADNVAPFPAPDAPRPLRILSRRISLSLPQLAAAAVLLMALSGSLVWSIASRTEGLRSNPNDTDLQVPGFSGNRADLQLRRDDDDMQVASVSFADQQYDAAVADLEKAVNRGRGRLDASTIAVVEQNLQIIDQAIAQARQALAADPVNSYLSGHLVEARRRKLDLLRRAAALTREAD
jgi:tetratricopeptide (TPR) repeat protein